MRKILSAVILMVILTPLYSQEKSIPYTQADRDRLVRVETRIEGMEKQNDIRFDEINKRIDELTQAMILGFSKADERMDRMEDNFNSYFRWGFGIIFMSIIGLVGFIIYDRRTTLAPVERKSEQIIISLRKLAETNTELKEILKNTALL